MTMPFDLTPRSAAGGRVPLVGIPEWYCWHTNDADFRTAPDRVVEDCVDAHLAAGFDWIAWNAGRSRVDYWTGLPHVTRHDEGVDPLSNSWEGFRARVMRRGCPLRLAIDYCARRGVPVLGRLGMNRHYGEEAPALRSSLAARRPEYAERARNGTPVPHKLCYAIPEVRQERLDILLEIQRIGVRALVLDYCRQVPILMYHEALVEPFAAAAGHDPRRMTSPKPEDWREWFQYRADVLTGFMRDLRVSVRAQERMLGRPCPIIARVPDNAPWLMVAFGLDMERWLADDLIDAVMLSPFPLAAEDPDRHPEYHIALAHRFGKACIAGIGSMGLILGDGPQPNGTACGPLRPAYELAGRQLAAGADAMSVYQTETIARLPHLKVFLRDVADPAAVRRRLTELPALEPDAPAVAGLDWHSRGVAIEGRPRKTPHSLRSQGPLAL